MDKVYYYFYKITNMVNGKYYYGVHSTTNLDDGYLGSGSIIKRAVKRCGKDSMKKEILKFFENEEDMFNYEAEFINSDVVADKNSYNLVEGGNGYRRNHSVPEEVRQKMSNKARGRKSKFKGSVHIHKGQNNKMIPKNELDKYLNNGWEKGFYISPESRDKLRTCPFKGKHHSEETKRRQSEIKKKQFVEGTWVPPGKGIPMSEERKELLRKINTGKHLSEERRKKISEFHRGKKHSAEWNKHISESHKYVPISEEAKQRVREKKSKKVDQFELNTEKYIQTFDSMKAAAIAVGHPKSNSEIAKCCKGILSQTCGFKWKWHSTDYE